MYFFIFKSGGLVEHVIQSGTREDAFIRLCSLIGYHTTWEHIGAEVSVIHCDFLKAESEQ